METNESISIKVRPSKRAFQRGLGELRKFAASRQQISGNATYDSATKTWTLTMGAREWAGLVSTWGSTAEALWVYRLEEVRS